MKRNQHMAILTAVLLAVLLALSCHREQPDKPQPELTVSLYIPGTVMTRAETGKVNSTEDEKRFTTLQIWVFLSQGGTPVSYKYFTAEDVELEESGLPNATVTRFGLPLTDEMFSLLTAQNRPKVDVYAVANAASAVSTLPGENTSRNVLDQMVMDGFGPSPLTIGVPDAGLPMSGVLKNAEVSGNYPVLNISTLNLTRAVSKLRFVFSQQAYPISGDTDPTPVNPACSIESITFDGTDNGKDCQIAKSQRLFTTSTTYDIGTPPYQYVPLDWTISGEGDAPLISNDQLALHDNPEELFFRSPGYESELAESYETRLNAAIDDESQVGPIYLRETNKTISGIIYYRNSAEGPVQEAAFSMEPGDIFSRNHSWIVYACFSEETMTLQLKVSVVDWDWTPVPVDYASGSVNVIRRFTVSETNPPTFKKVETEDGFYDIRFWDRLEGEDTPNVITGDIIIATPVGAKLHVIPVPSANDGYTVLTDAISVSPSWAYIYPNYDSGNGRVEDCRIQVTISCNRGNRTDAQLEGNYIDLHFSVEIGNEERFIDLGSESIDYYRFILMKEWDKEDEEEEDDDE